MGFIGNMVVPKTIDSYQAAATAGAIMTDSFLLALFAIQHSVMARPGFKRLWTRIYDPDKPAGIAALMGLPNWSRKLLRETRYH